jgi:hypothetical protein
MGIDQAAYGVFVDNQMFAWRADWAWGLPLIVLTVLIHVSGRIFTQHSRAGLRLCRPSGWISEPPKISRRPSLGMTRLYTDNETARAVLEVVKVQRQGLAVLVEGDDGLAGGEFRPGGWFFFFAEGFLLQLFGPPLLAGALFGALGKGCS